MKKNVIVKSNREYNYFGNVLEYEYDYFPSYSSTSTQKVLVHEYDYSISRLEWNVCKTQYYFTNYVFNTTFTNIRKLHDWALSTLVHKH